MRDIRVITPDDLGDGIVWNERTKKYEVSQSGGSSYPVGVGLRMKDGGTAIGVGNGGDNVYFIVCGMIFKDTQACLLGMHNNNEPSYNLLTLHLNGVSKKILWQWDGYSREFTQSAEFPTLEQDLFEPRIWTYGINIIQCADLQGNIRGQATICEPRLNGPSSTQRCMFGDIPHDGSLTNCVIWWAKIIGRNGDIQSHLLPYQKDGVWGFLNITSSNCFSGSEFLEPYQLG